MFVLGTIDYYTCFWAIRNGLKYCLTLTDQSNQDPLRNLLSLSLVKRDAIHNLSLDIF